MTKSLRKDQHDDFQVSYRERQLAKQPHLGEMLFRRSNHFLLQTPKSELPNAREVAGGRMASLIHSCFTLACLVARAICSIRWQASQIRRAYDMCYPRGCAAPGSVPCQCNTRESPSKLKRASPQAKINVTSKSPVGDISVVTLIRTDTTLDHS